MSGLSFNPYFMKEALQLARQSASEGEVPVGAVIVQNNLIVAGGRNKREQEQTALSHAEIEAINQACQRLNSWRLPDCTLYVTLEPCAMCAGAIINARIQNVVFGTFDAKAGSCGSVINLFDLPYNHKPQLLGGVLEDECGQILTDFFRDLRKSKK